LDRTQLADGHHQQLSDTHTARKKQVSSRDQLGTEEGGGGEGGNALSPTETMPVSTLPTAPTPSEPLLNTSETQNLSGFSVGRWPGLKESAQCGTQPHR